MRSLLVRTPPPLSRAARAGRALALAGLCALCAGCSASERRTALEPEREAALEGRAPRGPITGEARTVLDFAGAQVGKRYCWGGTGPSCFDCSGLVQQAWGRAGVRLPRTADAIASELPEVRLDEVRAGDILWWPGHVGLYAGDGWVVEALDRATASSVAPRRARIARSVRPAERRAKGRPGLQNVSTVRSAHFLSAASGARAEPRASCHAESRADPVPKRGRPR